MVQCKLGDHQTFQAHLPNPGRLWELLLPGSTVYYRRNKNSKYGYQVMGVERMGTPVMLHTHRTNQVVRRLINQRKVPGLTDWQVLKTEPELAEGRSDLLLQRGSQHMYLEIKTVTLFHHNFALFPDAVTKRGRRHLEELANLKNSDAEGGVLFVVQYPEVQYFLPEYHVDPAFSTTLQSVKDDIWIQAISIGWDKELNLQQLPSTPLTIPWHILEKEHQNRGTYMTLLYNSEPQKIPVGQKGKYYFQEGYYVYVGSGQNTLQKRMNRHRRTRKNCHWHIDYLRNHTQWLHNIPIRSPERLECQLAQSIKQIADTSIEGFGASDCSCKSHLFHFEQYPVHQPEFINTLLDYRVKRLQQLL